MSCLGINSEYWWSGIPKKMLYLFCYTAIGQMVSVCNYWNGKSDY